VFSKPIRVDLPISHAGAFLYWVEYDGVNPGERVKGREGYFNIDPILRTKARSPILSPDLVPIPSSQGGAAILPDPVNLPLDGLSILTVVSKWMGPMSGWCAYFEEAKDRGYTMLHWTPLQERGESNSPFSIRDQLKYEPSMFDTARKPDGGRAQVEAILNVAREEYGLLALTDVVLNHTANDSPWLLEHPEAGKLGVTFSCSVLTVQIGYTPANTPHLAPALEIDNAIIQLSASLELKGLPMRVESQQDVDTLTNALHTELTVLNLWQYYVLDMVNEKASVKASLENNSVLPWDGADVSGKSVVALAEILRASGKIQGLGKLNGRFQVHVDGAISAGFAQAAFVDLADNVEALVDAWARVVDVLNVPLYEEWEDDIKVALDNVRSRLKYTRLEESGPKMGAISQEYVRIALLVLPVS
jgi:glycogen debranching enzyme